jgi:tetratricopeptide (TPR) repeat protein
MDISPDDAEISDFALMPQLAANWDTLGWIKFRLGDVPAAKEYLEAAWQLMQSPAGGEHLVEVYERLGKKEQAAAICNMALSLGGDSSFHQKLSDEMTRLGPFLKASTGFGGRSIKPKGAMVLTEMRTLKIPFHTKLQGNSRSAEFLISLTNGARVDNVVFVSGAEELRNAIATIAGAKFAQTIPDDTPTRILRKATFSCSTYTAECYLVLMPVVDAAVPVNVPVTVN